MAKTTNHYDVAFEQLLRLLRRPYVSVNESRRALTLNSTLKSMDFIVYSEHQTNLLIDVKGRTHAPRSMSWKNWVGLDDIQSLLEWEQVFGAAFRAVLMFSYDVTNLQAAKMHDLTWECHGRRYAYYGVFVSEYLKDMRTLSPSWQTVGLSAQRYACLRRPILEIL